MLNRFSSDERNSKLEGLDITYIMFVNLIQYFVNLHNCMTLLCHSIREHTTKYVLHIFIGIIQWVLSRVYELIVVLTKFSS